MKRIIATKWDNDDIAVTFRDERTIEGNVQVDGDRQLNITITHEGLIIDCFEIDHDGNDQIVGTFGKMADEIFDWLTAASA